MYHKSSCKRVQRPARSVNFKYSTNRILLTRRTTFSSRIACPPPRRSPLILHVVQQFGYHFVCLCDNNLRTSVKVATKMARTKQTPKASSSAKTARKHLAFKHSKPTKTLSLPKAAASKTPTESNTESKQSDSDEPKTRKPSRFTSRTRVRRNLLKARRRDNQGKMWQNTAAAARMTRDAVHGLGGDNWFACEDSSSVRVTRNAIRMLNAFVQNTTATIMYHAHNNSQTIHQASNLSHLPANASTRLKPRWVLNAMSAFSDFGFLSLTNEFNELASSIPEYNDVSL